MFSIFSRIIISLKISWKIYYLTRKIESIKSDILIYKADMVLINQIYYCGRGDVDAFTYDYLSDAYFKIFACRRLIAKLQAGGGQKS